MTASYEPSAAVAAIRGQLDHPIIDCDGHIIEYLPLVRDILVELAGAGSPSDSISWSTAAGSCRCSRPRNAARWR
jgi:hypothetical protein